MHKERGPTQMRCAMQTADNESVDNFVVSISNPHLSRLKKPSPTQPSVQFRSCCSFQAKSPRKTACGCGLTPRQRQEVRHCRTHSRACKPSTRTVKLPPQGRRRLLFGGRNVCRKTPQIEYTFFFCFFIQNKKTCGFSERWMRTTTTK